MGDFSYDSSQDLDHDSSFEPGTDMRPKKTDARSEAEHSMRTKEESVHGVFHHNNAHLCGLVVTKRATMIETLQCTSNLADHCNACKFLICE